MTAVEIIDEIRHLAPGEKVQVVRYVRTLDEGHLLSGPELTQLACRLAEEPDPDESQKIKDQIRGGFYGNS
ncbi:MAG: hypothetical protein WCO94_06340 [Verrucomicrobiota bacterium]